MLNPFDSENLGKTEKEKEFAKCLQANIYLNDFEEIVKEAIKDSKIFTLLNKFNLKHEDLEYLWDETEENRAVYSNETEAFDEYDINYLNSLICNGNELEHVTKSGDTLLMFAAFLGFDELASDILKINKNMLNSTNKEGYTALMLASMKGNYSIVLELLNNGADINKQNKDGYTACELAFCREGKNGYYDDNYNYIVCTLIKAGAKITPAHIDILRLAFKIRENKIIQKILEINPELLLYEYLKQNESYLEHEKDENLNETILVVDEFFDDVKSNYELYTKKDRDQLHEFILYVINVYKEYIRNNKMTLKQIQQFYYYETRYKKDKHQADMEDIEEEAKFFELMENLKLNLDTLDFGTQYHFNPYYNQYNSRFVFIKMLQQNISIRVLHLDYIEALEDLLQIIPINHSLHNIIFSKNCEINQSNLQKFIYMIESSNIKRLKFNYLINPDLLPILLSSNNLIELENVNCQNWNNELSELLLKNATLKKLKLNVYGGGINDFFLILKDNTSIEELQLGYFSDQKYIIPKNEELKIPALIKNNTTIKKLILNFALTKIKQFNSEIEYKREIEKILLALKDNQDLQSIDFYFSNYIDESSQKYWKIQEWILKVCKNTLLENYTLHEFVHDQFAFNRENCPHQSMFYKLTQEIQFIMERNKKIQPLVNLIKLAKKAWGSKEFIEKTFEDIIEESYVMAKKIHEEFMINDIYLILAKLLAKAFPKNNEYAYKALELIPNSLYNLRREAQIIFAFKKLNEIPKNFLEMRPSVKNLILQLQKNNAENVNTMLSLDAEDSTENAKDQLICLLNAQKLSYPNALNSEEPPQLRRQKAMGEIEFFALNIANVEAEKNIEAEKTENNIIKIELKREESLGLHVNKRIDEIANAYAGFQRKDHFQNIQANSQTIVNFLEEIRRNNIELQKLKQQVEEIGVVDSDCTLNDCQNLNLNLKLQNSVDKLMARGQKRSHEKTADDLPEEQQKSSKKAKI